MAVCDERVIVTDVLYMVSPDDCRAVTLDYLWFFWREGGI